MWRSFYIARSLMCDLWYVCICLFLFRLLQFYFFSNSRLSISCFAYLVFSIWKHCKISDKILYTNTVWYTIDLVVNVRVLDHTPHIVYIQRLDIYFLFLFLFFCQWLRLGLFYLLPLIQYCFKWIKHIFIYKSIYKLNIKYFVKYVE